MSSSNMSSSADEQLFVTPEDRVSDVNQNSQQVQASDFTPTDLGFTPVSLPNRAPGNPVPQNRHAEGVSVSLIDAIHRLASEPDLRSHVPPPYDPTLYQSPINDDDDDNLIHLPAEEIIAVARRVEGALYQSPFNNVDYWNWDDDEFSFMASRLIEVLERALWDLEHLRRLYAEATGIPLEEVGGGWYII